MLTLVATVRIGIWFDVCVLQNHLTISHKAKTVGLTPEENEERAVLRRAYIDSVVGDLRQQLDNTYIVDGKGNKRKLRQ